jgi:hypothetical protein
MLDKRKVSSVACVVAEIVFVEVRDPPQEAEVGSEREKPASERVGILGLTPESAQRTLRQDFGIVNWNNCELLARHPTTPSRHSHADLCGLAIVHTQIFRRAWSQEHFRTQAALPTAADFLTLRRSRCPLTFARMSLSWITRITTTSSPGNSKSYTCPEKLV